MMQESFDFEPLSKPPEAGEAALQLFLAWLVGIMLLLLGGFLRRGSSSAVRTITGGIIEVISLAWCFLLGFSLIYPHHHHNVQWFVEGGKVNYAVDAGIGGFIWSSYFFMYFVVRKWRRRN
jgi:hypothetical protein